jgi:hypothetical protein
LLISITKRIKLALNTVVLTISDYLHISTVPKRLALYKRPYPKNLRHDFAKQYS